MSSPVSSINQQQHMQENLQATQAQKPNQQNRIPLGEIQTIQVSAIEKKSVKTLRDYAWSLVNDLLTLHKDKKNIAEASKELKAQVEKGIAIFEDHAKKQNKDPILFSAQFAKNVFALSSLLFDKQ